MDELLAKFVTETGERLDQLDVDLVRFEQEPNNAEMLNLASIDRIKEILTGLDRDGPEPPGSDADLIARLQMLALAEADTMPTYDTLGTVPIAADDSRRDLPPVQAALDEIERAWRAAPGPDPAESAKGLQSKGASVVEVNAREAQARAQTVRVSVDTLEQQ